MYWRFEVTYVFASTNSTSALDVVVNHPPENGGCSITPLTGTTSTLFTILCDNWWDESGVKDYVVYSECDSLRASARSGNTTVL